MVAAGHVEMCVNILRRRGKSSTKLCRLDDGILSGVERKFLLQNSDRVFEFLANRFAFGLLR